MAINESAVIRSLNGLVSFTCQLFLLNNNNNMMVEAWKCDAGQTIQPWETAIEHNALTIV